MMDKKDVEHGLLPKVGRYDFMVEPFHCDFRNRFFAGHLGNAMLNAADYHSNDRGYGMTFLNTIHRTWVLSRFAFELNSMPLAYDKITISTWVESAIKSFTSRNFAVKNSETNEIYGYGRSIWALIDTESRQPANLLEIKDGLIGSYIETSEPCPIAKPGRVTMDNGAALVREMDTCYSDVDVNGHVNSVKYIEHILDLFDIDFYRNHRLQRFEIAYVTEAHGGDKLSFYLEQKSDIEFCVKITRHIPEEIEVVRSLIRFLTDK